MNMHVNRPERAADSLPEQLAIQEQARQEALLTVRRLRKEARDEIDRLISFLDASDDYSTDEREEAVDDVPCDDSELEYSFSGVTADGHNLPGHSEDELEADIGSREADDEYSLGSRNPTENGSQEGWAFGLGGDLEDEHDGAEPDGDAEGDRADDEPSLGWTVDGCFFGMSSGRM